MNFVMEIPVQLNFNMSTFDRQDYTTLLNAILKQAMDDYVKLQHPRFRRKKYLSEAFDNAVDMFFDSDYRMMHVLNDDEEHIDLKTFVSEILNDDRIDINKLKTHVIDEARSFWETKMINTLYIPDNFIYDGHVYSILHSEDEDDFQIDFENKIINLNKNNQNSDNQQVFIKAIVNVVFYHEEHPISQKNINVIAKAMFKMLRMNACFIGD